MSNFSISASTLRWLEVIFAERFGHAWNLTLNTEGLRLRLVDAESAIIFDTLEDGFTQAHSDQSCTRWNAVSEGWHSVLGGELPAPGVASLPKPLIDVRGDAHIIHYDIPGLTYWMLARIEEIDRTDLDNHERFPATSSHAHKHSYLDRPVVDEWLHVLGQVIQRQWPGIKLKRHDFQMRVSHDVDRPSKYAFKSWKTITRIMVAQLLKRQDLKAFITAPYVKIATRDRLMNFDPFNTFDWLMDFSEVNGQKSAFYFICGKTHPNKDADYKVEHPVMRELLRRIHMRGHEIGLHPSYNTYRDSYALCREADILRRVCSEEGIQQTEWGGRMHYLRWHHPSTMRAWYDASMTYDSSLGYADQVGFRCGTCFEYPGFDPVARNSLSLRIRPLIAMETTILSSNYLGLGPGESAKKKLEQLKQSCQTLGGVFTLLWHNCQFEKQEERKLYQQLFTTFQTTYLEPHQEFSGYIGGNNNASSNR